MNTQTFNAEIANLELSEDKKVYYAIGVNGVAFPTGTLLSFWINKGCRVQAARLDGKYDVFMNGRKAATLYGTRNSQLSAFVKGNV